jgi:hypothetical protein
LGVAGTPRVRGPRVRRAQPHDSPERSFSQPSICPAATHISNQPATSVSWPATDVYGPTAKAGHTTCIGDAFAGVRVSC